MITIRTNESQRFAGPIVETILKLFQKIGYYQISDIAIYKEDGAWLSEITFSSNVYEEDYETPSSGKYVNYQVSFTIEAFLEDFANWFKATTIAFSCEENFNKILNANCKSAYSVYGKDPTYKKLIRRSAKRELEKIQRMMNYLSEECPKDLEECTKELVKCISLNQKQR